MLQLLPLTWRASCSSLLTVTRACTVSFSYTCVGISTVM